VPGQRPVFDGDRHLVTVDQGAIVQVRDCGACGNEKSLLDRAHARLTRHLTDKQLESYLGG
jgi:hypothetical protein